MRFPIRTKSLALLLVFTLLLTFLPSIPASAEESQQSGASTLTDTTETDTAAAATDGSYISSLATDCKILNYVDAEVFASHNHVLRLTEDETLSTYAFLNADGTKTVYYLDEAVKFVDTDGVVQEIDLTLTSTAGGYTTVHNSFDLTIPTNPSSGVTLLWNGNAVRLIPQGGVLRETVVENNTVRYPGYYGNGTTLVYTPTLSGVKEDIILDYYTGQTTFTFMLNTGGLSLYSTNGRYYLAKSKTADERIDLGDVVTYDARGRFSVGTITAQTVTAGQIYRLTVTVDEAFLTDPNITYPVSIDPTLDISSEDSVSLIEDASIYSGKPTLNTGAWLYAHCGYYDSEYQVARTLYRLSGLLSNSIYQTIQKVESAEFYVQETTGTAPVNVHLYSNTGSPEWQENTVTWNNADITLGARIDSVPAGNDQFACFDITTLVQSWKAGIYDPECGFVLVSSDETTTDKAFCTSEYSTVTCRPYVVVNYGFDYHSSDYTSADLYRGTYLTTDYYAYFIPMEIYADDSLQLRSNCYGYAFRFYYALNNFTDEMTFELANGNYYKSYKQQPGEFANKYPGLAIYNTAGTSVVATLSNYDDLKSFYQNTIFSSSITNSERMNYLVQLMQADAAELGYTMTEYTSASLPDAWAYNNKRLIAVVVNQNDYHFYMQHSDNTWSHKPGSDAPQNDCFDCDIVLTNDNIRAHACEGIYEGAEIKFFYITKSAIVDYGHLRGTYTGCKSTSNWTADLAGNQFISSIDLGEMPIEFSDARIDYINDVDFFSFKSSTAGTYSVTTSSFTSIPLTLQIFDYRGNLLYTYTSSNGSISTTVQLSEGQEYFAAFSSPNQTAHSQTAWYDFEIILS